MEVNDNADSPKLPAMAGSDVVTIVLSSVSMKNAAATINGMRRENEAFGSEIDCEVKQQPFLRCDDGSFGADVVSGIARGYNGSIVITLPVFAASTIASVTSRFCRPSATLTSGSAAPRITAAKCSICSASGSARSRSYVRV